MKKRNIICKRVLNFCAVLVLGLFALVGCQSSGDGYSVTFNTCTNLETNKLKDRTVKAGEKIARPNLYMADEKYNNYLVEGWYLDPDYQKMWNFDTDVVEGDIVLYAKWGKQYSVRYFCSNMNIEKLSVNVKEGETAPTQEYIYPGYKVLGYYADAGYSIPYDFTQKITQDTDIYLRMSEGIHWDGKTIYENYKMEKATGDKSTLGEITYVEEEGESYARVDFGYAERADSRMTVFPGLDMTNSQILTIKYKNLGHTPQLRFYWTVTYADGTISGQDGQDRTWDHGEVDLKTGMSESDDWATLTIDMGELSKINGASQWAGGKILSMLRIDSLYSVSTEKEWVDNIILFKEISFAAGEEVVSADSIEIQADNVFDMMAAGEAQESVTKGLIFPKDREHSLPKQGTVQYNMKDCATYFFPYGTKQGLVSYDMSDMNIDMKSNQKIYIKYKNEGYGTRLTVRYHTKDGKTGEQTVTMKKKMKQYAKLEVNMLNDEDWNGKLETIDLIYNKKDTNNVLSVASIYLEKFVATDLPGINFVDDKCAGFTTNDNYKIVFDSKSEGSYIEMLKEQATLQKNVSIDTTVYDALEFSYSIPTAGVDGIEIGYQIGGKWYTESLEDVKRTSGFETVTLPLQKKGTVTKMRIVLDGKGKLSLRSLQFKVNKDYALDFSDGKYVKDHFNLQWTVNYGVDYDSTRGAAYLTGSASKGSRCMFYLGASGYMNNISLDAASKKIYVCYNNPGEAREASLNVYYAGSANTTGSGIAGDDKTVSQTKSVSATAQLQGNMKAGEWAVAVFDYSSLDLFSSSRNATMLAFEPGGDLYLRSIVLK